MSKLIGTHILQPLQPHIMLKQGNKTPAHSIIVITTKTEDGDTSARYADIDDKQTDAATCSSQHVATLETIINKEEESEKKSHTACEKQRSTPQI